MIDQDESDQEVLAVPSRNARYDEHFFTIYKELEGCNTVTLGWGTSEDARRVILDGRKKYLG